MSLADCLALALGFLRTSEPVAEDSPTPTDPVAAESPADPATDPATPSDPATAPELATPEEPSVRDAATPYAVPDESWQALVDREVIVVNAGGEARGTVLGYTADTVTIAYDGGTVRSVGRWEVLEVRLAESAVAPVAEPARSPIVDTDQAEPTAGDRAVRLAAFIAQGPGFGFWTASGLTGKTVAYRLDGAIGMDLRQRMALFAVAGGLLGGRIDDDVRASYGHLLFAAMPHGRYFGAQFGIGLAFSRLMSTHDRADRFEDLGLAVPFRLMGLIPLPQRFKIGIGISYEFAALQGFQILYNMLALELTVGRW